MAGTGGKASFTERYATLRRATVAYAPPEMLTDDIPDLRALRMSPAIDVYAAASTVYELIAGVAPYEAASSTSGTSGSRKDARHREPLPSQDGHAARLSHWCPCARL